MERPGRNGIKWANGHTTVPSLPAASDVNTFKKVRHSQFLANNGCPRPSPFLANPIRLEWETKEWDMADGGQGLHRHWTTDRRERLSKKSGSIYQQLFITSWCSCQQTQAL